MPTAVPLSESLTDHWETGHWFFETPESFGSVIHTDERFDVESVLENDSLRREVIDRLADVILEANPDYLIDCTGFPAHWMTYVSEKIYERTGRIVYVIDAWDIDNFNRKREEGKAIIFVDAFTLGSSAQWGLSVARKFGLETTGVVTIVDRSQSGTFGWESLSIGALYRKRTKLWLVNDCPHCKDPIRPINGYLHG